MCEFFIEPPPDTQRTERQGERGIWVVVCCYLLWAAPLPPHLAHHFTCLRLCLSGLDTVKIFSRIPVFFFTKPFRNGKTPMLTRDFLVPSREGIFCLLRGKSIPLSAGVIFSSLLNVIFPYFPYFPIKFTGKLLEDSWLATGAPGRVAIKFGRWQKNSARFVKLQVWNLVKILVNQSYYYREN